METLISRGEEISNLVKEQAKSGKSVPAFCIEKGLRIKTFYQWRKRYGEKPEGGFARVISEKKIELELKNGSLIRIAKEDLKVVLEALG